MLYLNKGIGKWFIMNKYMQLAIEEAKERVKEMAEMYNVDEETILKEVSLENIKFDKMYQKALEIVTANESKKEEK